jgi:hypothetical protein
MTEFDTVKPRRPALRERFRAVFGLRTSAERTMALKERIYASFTGLAIVSALSIGDHHGTAGDAIWSLTAGIVGITAAGLVAEVIAHQVGSGSYPTPLELVRMVRIALGAITSASLPFLVLAGSAIGAIALAAALQIAMGLYFAGLIVVVLVAARRTRLPWRKQLLSAAALVGGGIVVVAVLTLAH